MSVRPSKFADILRLADLAREAHQRSIYADFTPDERVFKNLCIEAARQHGKAGCLFVAEHNGVVEGFIIGAVNRLYHIGKEFEAREILFYVSPRGNQRDASHLVDAFLSWAEHAPNVVAIYTSATDLIGDPSRTSKLYRRKGLTQCGVIHSKRIKP